MNGGCIVLNIDGREIKASDSMKVLGIIFDEKLEWEKQVSSTVLKTNKMLHGLRRRFLNVEQARLAVTAFYFSSLYYGLEVWFHRGLGFHLKKKIRAAHYRALRLIFGKTYMRDELDLLSKRATPDEWADYRISKMIASMVQRGSPRRLLQSTLMTSYSERRQGGQLFFFDSSTRKIGRQCFKNRLQCVAKQMKFSWLECELNSLRPKLKKSFFKYSRL